MSSIEFHLPVEPPLNILVVEDSIPYAKLVISRLKRGLMMPHEIRHVDLTCDGVNLLLETEFDLIVLDMHLPDTDGIQTFEAIYNAAPEAPIVILSSDESEDLALEAVKRGAQDYLIKGAEDGHKLTWSVRFAIERKKRLHAEGEVQAARRIQESLLPEQAPIIKGYELFGAMFPAVETAGDYFDFLVPMPAAGNDVYGIAVGDVSGHGLGAAMMMAETRSCLHSFAILEANVARMLTYTNRVLVQNRNSLFVTLFLGYIDESTRCLNYAAAGHNAWHLSATGQATELEATGIPLGISDEDDDVNWTAETSAPLSAGDFLLIMTDGISESRGTNGEMFGDERIFEFVHQHRNESAQQIVTLLREHLRQYTSNAPQVDDITIVIVKVVL